MASGYGFTGQPWDAEIGLYYYRARYYDPALGRFISRDPAEWGDGTMNWGAGNINWTTKEPSRFVGGLNLYAYVDNDPVNKVDPTGLGPWDFIKCIIHEGSIQKCWLEEERRLNRGPAGEERKKDHQACIDKCSDEILQPRCPGGNEWDYWNCVNDCMREKGYGDF